MSAGADHPIRRPLSLSPIGRVRRDDSSLVRAGAAAKSPTYYKDVLPVFQQHCQECHRKGEAAPFAMTTYAETRPWAKAIRGAVLTGKMPPWFADAPHGVFSNDRRMSQAAIDTVRAWVDAGAPEGDAPEAPAPATFIQGWRIGKPDLVFEMPQAFEVARERRNRVAVLPRAHGLH